MYKNVLTSIEGIEIYPLISLTIFVAFFVALGVFVIKADKKHIEKMKNKPLES